MSNPQIAQLVVLCACAAATAPGFAATESVTLKGHVHAALGKATKLPTRPEAAKASVTITLVLNRTSRPAFEEFTRGQERLMAAGEFRPLEAKELTARFGPSAKAYDDVLAYLRKEGFTLIEGSTNRLTVTVRGTRAQAEHAFGVPIHDYRLGPRTFFANDREPSLPRAIGPLVASIWGLSNYVHLKHFSAPSPVPSAVAKAYGVKGVVPDVALGPGGLNGAGQVVGLPETFTFVASDVSDWLNSVGLPASLLTRVHSVPVAGGTSVTDPEVVLDIDSIVGFAPGAVSYTVFSSPAAEANLVAVLNAAISGMPAGSGSRVISFSYGVCETDFTSAQLDSTEAVIASGNMAGVSVFVSSGDNANMCVSNCDASGNCASALVGVNFPASAPHAIAVGGTNLQVDGAGNYQSESWWAGAGGFGVSPHFPRPSYQTAFTNASGRSVPDVSADADPATGINICYSGCGQGYGGTSMAAPFWAGAWALVAQASGSARAVGTNSLLYSLPASAFHRPSTMTPPQNDFAHLGLGSPNLAGLVPPCGQKQNEPCCNGKTCSAAFSCAQGTCQCGGQDQPCCAGSHPCGSQLVCAGNVCRCGGNNQPCCGANQDCDGGFSCVPTPSGNLCKCGDLYEACCNGTTCDSALLVCSPAKGNTCISACGHKGEPCCHSSATLMPPTHAGDGPGWCYGGEGVSCSNDTCVCGGKNQACCLTGTKCGAGLQCTNLTCTPTQSGGTTCSQCSVKLASCLQGCKTDPAHQALCDCLCQTTACDCRQNSACGLFCQFPVCNSQ